MAAKYFLALLCVALLCVALLCVAMLARRAAAEDVAAFYKGRTISVVIGTSVGGGYDLYARVLARHLGTHIPGNPTLVPQNMPGAGTLRAILYLADVAPKDGTVIGTFARGMPLAPLLGLPGAKFDPTKLTWLGSITRDTVTCVSWHDSKVRNWADLMTQKFIAGGEGKGADPDIGATLLKNLFGAPVQLVTGYPGMADMALAMERGELDGTCGLSYSSLRSTHPDWLKKNLVNILVQGGLGPDAMMPDVPFLPDLAKTEAQKQIVELLLAPQAMARPFAAPAGIPPDRARALEDAFDATMKDPDFLGEAQKLDLDVNPLSGLAVQGLLARLYGTPKDIVRQAASYSGY